MSSSHESVRIFYHQLTLDITGEYFYTSGTAVGSSFELDGIFPIYNGKRIPLNLASIVALRHIHILSVQACLKLDDSRLDSELDQPDPSYQQEPL